jgi:membrane protein implicated in regulation of membrane protease activity
VGVVKKRIPLENEPPDFDYARLLFSVILFVDLVAILGVFALIILAGFVILAVLALILNATWLLGIMGFLIQFFFSFLTPIINIFTRRENRQTVPVVNYTMGTTNGKEFTARIKGQLRGTVPQEGDRFSLTGVVRHGILHVRGGFNLKNNEPILLPIRWSGLWLVLIIIANLAGLIYYLSQR